MTRRSGLKITCLLVCQVRPPDGVTCGSRWPGLTFLEACSHLSLQRVTCVAGTEVMRAGKSPACVALSDSCLSSECSSTKRARGCLHLPWRRPEVFSNESVMQGKVSCTGQLTDYFARCSTIRCIETCERSASSVLASEMLATRFSSESSSW